MTTKTEPRANAASSLPWNTCPGCGAEVDVADECDGAWLPCPGCHLDCGLVGFEDGSWCLVAPEGVDRIVADRDAYKLAHDLAMEHLADYSEEGYCEIALVGRVEAMRERVRELERRLNSSMGSWQLAKERDRLAERVYIQTEACLAAERRIAESEEYLRSITNADGNLEELIAWLERRHEQSKTRVAELEADAEQQIDDLADAHAERDRLLGDKAELEADLAKLRATGSEHDDD